MWLRLESCLLPLTIFGYLSCAWAADGPQTQSKAPGNGSLIIREEPDRTGTRVRVSTRDMEVLSEKNRSLSLRLQCLHPLGAITVPDQCVVYLISKSRSHRYRTHDTQFTAVVDGVSVIETPFKSYTVLEEGATIVEPLTSDWRYSDIKALSLGSSIIFTLAGERITVPVNSLVPCRQLVEYFSK